MEFSGESGVYELTQQQELFLQALREGNLAEAIPLLENYPELIETRDEDRRVALHYAAELFDLPVVQQILSLNRSFMDAQDEYGFTPLFEAVTAGNIDVLEYLIDQGAQYDHIDREKRSAIHWAVIYGKLDTLLCLLKHGAPFDISDVYGACPIHYATRVHDDVPMERAETILHALFKAGASPNCADNQGLSPLHWASSNGNVTAFKSLIQAGANKFTVDRDNLGVLHCAARHGHAEILELMADLSPIKTVDMKDRNYRTPLFYAATYGHHECVKLLLEKGADPNHLDKKLSTVSHCAASKGQLRILQLLRQYGASFDFQNYRGDLPFHEAVQIGIKELVEWMADIDNSFVCASNFYGRHPLHLAAASGNMEVVVMLCSRNAKINPLMLYKNELMTPLDLAKMRGHDLVVEYLTVRHEALTANEISQEKREFVHNSIEEQLKEAKLRRLRAELSADSSSDEQASERKKKMYKRGISLSQIERRKKPTYSDVGTMVSRRSSSATNATESKADETKFARHSKDEFMQFSKPTNATDVDPTLKNKTFEATRQRFEQNHGADKENSARIKHSDQINLNQTKFEQQKLAHETIRKIVQKELEKIQTRENNETTYFTQSKRQNIGINKGKVNATTDNNNKVQAEAQSSTRATIGIKQYNSNNGKPSVDSTNDSAVEKALDLEGYDEEDYEGSDSLQSDTDERPNEINLRTFHPKHRDKSVGLKRVRLLSNATKSMDEHGSDTKNGLSDLRALQRKSQLPDLDELNLISDEINLADNLSFINDSMLTRRFVHEKAIFDELTHLKLTQIQYGKVQEEILVRTLINNFCKMHGLHPQHFRRILTFQEWEKFLYDQLKMIYLEERDRIHSAAVNAARRAAVTTGLVPRSFMPRQLFAYANSPSLSTNFVPAKFHETKSSLLDDGIEGLKKFHSSTRKRDEKVKCISTLNGKQTELKKTAEQKASGCNHGRKRCECLERA